MIAGAQSRDGWHRPAQRTANNLETSSFRVLLDQRYTHHRRVIAKPSHSIQFVVATFASGIAFIKMFRLATE